MLTVAGLDKATAGEGWAYNLTVDDLHTYYVGDEEVLVHNTGGESCDISPTYNELRAAGKADGHHIIQDAAVRDVPGYSRGSAPAIHLEGPSTKIGSPHYNATQVQRAAGGGTYAAEREIAACGLAAAGCSPADVASALGRADSYFMGELGLTMESPLRIPGNRARTR